jgi:hypothetical protein
MTQYKLTLPYEPIIIEEDNGNFSVRKQYNVSKIPKKNIEGIIVQYVDKRTEVADALGNIYNTTDDIRKLTSGIVQYSNDSYFEIFNVFKNGNSKNADAFQNGSIVQYELERGKLLPNTYDVEDPLYEKYKTQGNINVVGRNCFISSTNPNYSTILNLPWSWDQNTPAFGLPYLPYSPERYNLIFSSTDSNILIHNVNVKWTFNNPKSIVTSEVITSHHGIIYGGSIHTRKHRRKDKSHRHKKMSKSRKMRKK